MDSILDLKAIPETFISNHFCGLLKGRAKRYLEQSNKGIIRWNSGHALKWSGPKGMSRKLKGLPSSL